MPKRLTWHPGPDVAQGFTPDGKSVLFTSPRDRLTRSDTRQLFTVPIDGGSEELLPIPHANEASYSPDGKRIAYNPLGPQFLQWKRYRGGTVSQVWLYDRSTTRSRRSRSPRRARTTPARMWVGDTVYFRSDRDGEFNLCVLRHEDEGDQALTNHSDFPVLNASAGGGRIVYEQAGYLHLLRPGERHPRRS